MLVLTMFDDDATVFTAMQAGARGYLLKGAEQEEIVGAHPRGGRRTGDLRAGRRGPGARHFAVTADAAPSPTRSRS